jgi:N-acetylglutamate synthase-like GNAT family acetyltransferase
VALSALKLLASERRCNRPSFRTDHRPGTLRPFYALEWTFSTARLLITLSRQEGTARHFTITRATISDADGIVDCLRAAFEPYRQQYTPAAYADTVMTAESAQQRIQTMNVLVARDERGALVGTVGAAVHAPEGHIRGMAVLPAAQGSGLADQLIKGIRLNCSQQAVHS